MDNLLDIVNVVRGSREMIDPGDSQFSEVVQVVGGDFLGEVLPIFFLLLGLVDDFVVDVGDVDHQGNLIAEVREIALDGIEDDRADHVAEVAWFIDGRSADVDANLVRLDGLERLLLAGESVVSTQGHGVFLAAKPTECFPWAWNINDQSARRPDS